jgi:hypothetical protein
MGGLSPGTLLRFELPAQTLSGESMPLGDIRSGKYVVRFARSKEEVDLALRLRFKVLNLEFGEGKATSFRTGRHSAPADMRTNLTQLPIT